MKEKEELSVSQMPDLLSFVNGNSERSASDLSVFDPLLNYEISIDSKAPPSTATTKTHLIESLSKSIEADLILIQNNQENSGLQSHCKTLYSFRDRASDSLEFDAGEVVRLLRRVGDGQWLEGELRGKVGMFPASYVQIIVDLPKQESTCQTLPEQLSAVTKSNDVNGSKSGMNEAICLYNFQSQERGDVSLYEGERAVILQRVDINWYIVRNSSGECGLCPANYLKLLDSAIIDRNGVFESQTVSRNCMTKSQRELDISSETFTDSVNLSQPTVVPALNKSTSLSQSQADNLSGHSTDSDSQRTLLKSLYTIDSSIQSSVNSFNGVANVWCLDRRSSCPTSSHVKTATPPSRPPPPVITDRKSVSSPARRHPRGELKRFSLL